MVAFALRGGGGVATPPRIYLTSLSPGRREVRPRISTPVTYTLTSKIYQGKFIRNLCLQSGTVIGALGGEERCYAAFKLLLRTWPSACYERVDVLSQLLDICFAFQLLLGT